jgi:hypothetical protein
MDHYSHRQMTIGAGWKVERAIQKKIDGDPKSKRVRVVCGKCNGGWMSGLQEKAKPFIVPLMLGQPTVLRPPAQQTVAAWATMAVMAAEYVDKGKIVVTQLERTRFKETLVPLPTWRIWIGRYKRGQWRGYWTHNSIHFVPAEEAGHGKQQAPAQKNLSRVYLRCR